MNLKRRSEGNEPKKPVQGKPIKVNWKTHEIDYDAILSYGKYIGRSLGQVKDHDDWYYNWMRSNNIIESWGLYKPKYKTVKEDDSDEEPFVSSSGDVWLFLYEVIKDQQCESCD